MPALPMQSRGMECQQILSPSRIRTRAYDERMRSSVRAAQTAKQMEAKAARARPPGKVNASSELEAVAALVRRGLRPTPSKPDLPFPKGWDAAAAEHLALLLGHYAFRLFLRGAILHPEGFRAAEVTQYVSPATAKRFASTLQELGLLRELSSGFFRLVHPAKSFGGVLEWYVARELRRRLGFEVATGLKCRVPGVGGDLDVVAVAEGKLVYLEVKSSPPKHLTQSEVEAFFERVEAVRPDVALFVLDTALRLEDKVIPMLLQALHNRRADPSAPSARRIVRELWSLAPHLYAVNAKTDLVANIALAIAEGFRALAPRL